MSLNETQARAVADVTESVTTWRPDHDRLNRYLDDTVFADGEDPLRDAIERAHIQNVHPGKHLLALFAIAEATPIVRAIETGFIPNGGDWTATDSIERRGVAPLLQQLRGRTGRQPQYRIFKPSVERARFFVSPGVVQGMGCLAIRRQRVLYESLNPRYAIIPRKRGEYVYPNKVERQLIENGQPVVDVEGQPVMELLSLGPIERVGGETDLQLVRLVAQGFKRSAFALDASQPDVLGPLYEELEEIYRQAEDAGVIERTPEAVCVMRGSGQQYEIAARASFDRLQRAIENHEEILLPAATGYVHTQTKLRVSRVLHQQDMQRITGITDNQLDEARTTGLFIPPSMAADLSADHPEIFFAND